MRIHRVNQGETLSQIGSRFGTTTSQLQTLNGLTSTSVVPGLHLLVPYPQPALPQAAQNKRSIQVNGYLIPTGSADASVLGQVGNNLTYMCVFSYQARADGSLAGQPDETALATARNYGMTPLVTVTNFDGTNFNSDLARTVMSDAGIRSRLISNIISTARSKGYRGVNVDFEHMYAQDRPLYNNFIRQLGQSVRSQGLSMSIAMGPKTSDAPQQPWMGAFDYRTLGQEVDFLMLMTYEWGWVGGPPMAIAPLNQVRAVLNYATSVIDPQKILMGMALYGYDWPLPHTPTSRASGLANDAAQNLAIATQSPILWNETWQSPYFNYTATTGQQHQVWFEDALSALTKMQLVYDLNLRGISYWVLGHPFTQNWFLLQDNFTITKLRG